MWWIFSTLSSKRTSKALLLNLFHRLMHLETTIQTMEMFKLFQEVEAVENSKYKVAILLLILNPIST